MPGRIAFQGELGAYSHQACRQARPDMEAVPCATFEEAIDRCRSGDVALAMLGLENSTYGRVADVHRLLPDSGLHIIDEAFVRVHINLLAVKGTKLADVKRVRCMSILLGQCGTFLKDHNLATLNWTDNAAAARDIAALGDPAEAALASELAGEIYGLDILARQIEDQSNNTTRFLVMSRDADHNRRGTGANFTPISKATRTMQMCVWRWRSCPTLHRHLMCWGSIRQIASAKYRASGGTGFRFPYKAE